MESTVAIMQPSGDGEQYLVDIDCRRRGLPPCEREWVCQHSCAPEKIPDCQDWNCEGTTVVNSAALDNVCAQAARGEFATFELMTVRLKLAAAPATLVELAALAGADARLPQVEGQGEGSDADARGEGIIAGSLPAFARLAPCQADESVSPPLRQLIAAIEETLVRAFGRAGEALFRQRFCDLRHERASRGNVIVFLGRAAWPAQALIAWEAAHVGHKRRPLPPEPQANRGFGLLAGKDRVHRLGWIDSGLQARPGDLYGPTTRIEFRVDQAVADRVADLCQAQASGDAGMPGNRADDAMLELLRAFVNTLGLPVPRLPAVAQEDESVYVRPARWMRGLLLAQPLTSR